MDRTKFNVDKDKEARTCDGVTFDSKLEMRYYRDVLCPKVESGEVVHYELQKEYELQPGFKRNGKVVRPITYVADFYIEYADGHVEVVDTKGCPDNLAKMKRKMFWFVYPDVEYLWIVYIKKFGGWLEYDEANRLRKEEKRMKKLKEEQKDGEQDGEQEGER